MVPGTYKAKAGNTSYNNFDIDKDMGVSQSEIDQVNDVKQMVTKNAGRMNHGDYT
jgi:pectate lyase